MAVSKDAIRKALETLSYASKDDYDGMEAEYFASIAKLTNDYHAYVRYSMVKNNLNRFTDGCTSECPKCNTSKSIYLMDLTLCETFLSPYIIEKEEKIEMYTDTNDLVSPKNFKSKEFESLLNFIKSEKPEMLYLINNHAYCVDCKISFPANKSMLEVIGKKISFDEIIDWLKNNKDTNDLE